MGLLHTFMSCIFKYNSKYCHSNDIYKENQQNLNGTIHTLRQFLANLHYRLRTALLKKNKDFFSCTFKLASTSLPAMVLEKCSYLVYFFSQSHRYEGCRRSKLAILAHFWHAHDFWFPWLLLVVTTAGPKLLVIMNDKYIYFWILTLELK